MLDESDEAQRQHTMTGPEDSHSNTRPISVAELLAKNGTIGAPPVGGRRRRRRGNSDAVTVAELTGEIPIVSENDVKTDEPAAAAEHESVDETGPVPTNGMVKQAEDAGEVEDEAPVDDDYADAVADYSSHIEQRDADDAVDFFTPPRRPHYAHAARRARPTTGVDAEHMSPDPVIDDEDAAADEVDLIEPPEIEEDSPVDVDDHDELPSYLRSSQGPLFGGQTVADDLARRGGAPAPEDIDLEDQEEAAAAPSGGMSSFLRGAWIVGQCIIAVAFGAGLFIAFDQLWKWNNIVALVLSVLVILGLVVGVRVVRKTEDIGSTLIAVAVGALVTLGPLALLQSG
jgi:hypothetical protein